MAEIVSDDTSLTAESPALSIPAIMRGAMAAGVPADEIVVPWLEFSLSNKDLPGAREVIETCAAGLSLLHLSENWTWPEALSGNARLREILTVSHYYQLDDALNAAGRGGEAEEVLHHAMSTYPQYSGPRLRLAERCYQRKDIPGGDEVLVDYLRHHPADASALLPYALRVAQNGTGPESEDVFLNAIAHGALAEQLFPYWLEGCLRKGDLMAARRAVEACAEKLDVTLEPDWTWPALIAGQHRLPIVSLETIYRIDDLLTGVGSKEEAEALLRATVEARHTLSGPALRLAGRFHAENRGGEGDEVLASFLNRVPSDEQVVLTLGRRAIQAGMARDAIRIIKAAVEAGAPPTALVGLWVECCLEAKDMIAARSAINATAVPLGLAPLDLSWTWQDVLRRSPALARALHLSHYYKLEDHHLAIGDVAGADGIIRAGIDTYPKFSGPVLRYAERLYARGENEAADLLLVDFLKVSPGDVRVATTYARQVAKRQAAERAK